MISLQNISKTYTTTAKTKTQALKNISLDIADRGMVFILGKSGSGKSTLLNLLGGLDAPTEGEILIDGVSMKQFSQRDYDTYRNNYVGFIFQEFNLLADFNVRDNVALALTLSKSDNIDEKVAHALKQVELSDDYLNRRVDEMSGGEKQRIAIARAIIKDSKIILADEPTGNLDSATGESIWQILKNLSRERLVVVVSHDRESAEKYSDRIIEIADGLIKSDSGATQADGDVHKNSDERVFLGVRNSLPFATCLKMGVNNLAQRKAKTVSVILISILTILTLLITEMFIAFSPLTTIVNFIKRYDIEYFAVQQWLRNEDGDFRYRHILRDDSRNYIDENCDYLIDNVVQNKQQLIDFGFTFYGEALELTPNSYYITKYEIENLIRLDTWGENYYIGDNGKEYALIEETPLESLIGKKVYLPAIHPDEDNLFTIAGIIDTDVVNQKMLNYIPPIFVTEDYEGKHYYDYQTVNNVVSNATMQLADSVYQSCFDICGYVPTDGIRCGMMTADGLLSYEEMRQLSLEDDEIVLTYEMYAKLFDAKSKWYYVDSNITSIHEDVELPTELNQKLSLKFYNSVSGDVIVDLGEVRLVGIIFQSFYLPEQSERNLKIAVSEQNNVILQDLLNFERTILVKTDTVKNLSNFIYTLNGKYDVRIVNVGKVDFISVTGSTHDVVDEVYILVETMNRALFVMITICVIMVVLLVLLVINLISLSITNRKREIGILSALGTTNKDVTKIFLFETLVIAAISFVITLILVFILAVGLNVIVSYDYEDIVLSMFRVDIVTVAVLAASSFGLLLLAAWIPTRQIAKLKPIDAIRNV